MCKKNSPSDKILPVYLILKLICCFLYNIVVLYEIYSKKGDIMNNQNIKELKKTALEIRKLILKTTFNAGCGHTGGSLSEADILTALYFRIMKIKPDNPDWTGRDRFILSKGHATPGYYSTLALRGYFDIDELDTFDKQGSILQGHPDMHKTPGVDISSGSLGQGLSAGIGMRLAGMRDNNDFRVFVLLGDGESQEGQIWEAAMYAGSRKVRGLIGITDYNKIQLSESVRNILPLEPLSDKWKAFGWSVIECDGNDMNDLVTKLETACNLSQEKPVMVLANTIKGKGVSFMEGNYKWHGKAPDRKEYEAALMELEGEIHE